MHTVQGLEKPRSQEISRVLEFTKQRTEKGPMAEFFDHYDRYDQITAPLSRFIFILLRVSDGGMRV